MGNKFSRGDPGSPEELPEKSPGAFSRRSLSLRRSRRNTQEDTTNTLPPRLERGGSISRRLRRSCRNWATKRGLVQGKEGQEETAHSAPEVEVMVIEVGPEEVMEEDDVVEEPEMDVAVLVAQLVVEAHKRKLASRAASRAPSKEKLTDEENERNTEQDKEELLQDSERCEEEALATLVETEAVIETQVTPEEEENTTSSVLEIETEKVGEEEEDEPTAENTSEDCDGLQEKIPSDNDKEQDVKQEQSTLREEDTRDESVIQDINVTEEALQGPDTDSSVMKGFDGNTSSHSERDILEQEVTEEEAESKETVTCRPSSEQLEWKTVTAAEQEGDWRGEAVNIGDQGEVKTVTTDDVEEKDDISETEFDEDICEGYKDPVKEGQQISQVNQCVSSEVDALTDILEEHRTLADDTCHQREEENIQHHTDMEDVNGGNVNMEKMVEDKYKDVIGSAPLLKTMFNLEEDELMGEEQTVLDQNQEMLESLFQPTEVFCDVKVITKTSDNHIIDTVEVLGDSFMTGMSEAAYVESTPPHSILGSSRTTPQEEDCTTVIGLRETDSLQPGVQNVDDLVEESVNGIVDETVTDPVDEVVDDYFNEYLEESLNESVNESVNAEVKCTDKVDIMQETGSPMASIPRNPGISEVRSLHDQTEEDAELMARMLQLGFENIVLRQKWRQEELDLMAGESIFSYNDEHDSMIVLDSSDDDGNSEFFSDEETEDINSCFSDGRNALENIEEEDEDASMTDAEEDLPSRAAHVMEADNNGRFSCGVVCGPRSEDDLAEDGSDTDGESGGVTGAYGGEEDRLESLEILLTVIGQEAEAEEEAYLACDKMAAMKFLKF